jgi:hypothetical protein
MLGQARVAAARNLAELLFDRHLAVVIFCLGGLYAYASATHVATAGC